LAYTYLIGWSKLNKWYYGVRFSKNCSPDDLWVKYFTSSKYVKEYRKNNGEPDIVEVRKIFESSEEARNWETRFIKKIKAVGNSNWLNKTDNTNKFYSEGELSLEHKKKLSKIRSEKNIGNTFRKGKKFSEESILKLKISRNARKDKPMLGKKMSDEAKNKMRLSKLGKKMNDSFKISCSERNKKRYEDPENRKKISEKMKEVWKIRKMKENLRNLGV
jgi:hypothetical protein